MASNKKKTLISLALTALFFVLVPVVSIGLGQPGLGVMMVGPALFCSIFVGYFAYLWARDRPQYKIIIIILAIASLNPVLWSGFFFSILKHIDDPKDDNQASTPK